MEKVVLQARRGSDRRVRATSGRCSAENELEEALLELTVRNDFGSPTVVYASWTHGRGDGSSQRKEHVANWSVNLTLRS